jgi:hypothetical protein
MKNLLTNSISTTVGFPVKSGTLDFLQTASSEMLVALGRSIIGRDYSTSIPYALYGCNNTGSGSSYVIQEGAILWGGVLYLVPAVSFTLTGGNSVYVIGSTSYVTSSVADPVTFTDGVARSVHADTKMSVYQSALAPSPSVGFSYSALKYINQISETLTLTTNYSTFGGLTPKVNLINSEVSFSGIIVCGVGATISQTITTLPSKFRPSTTKKFSIVIANSANIFLWAVLNLSTAGVLQVEMLSSGSLDDFSICLDGLNYRLN